ncbi:hypothetical protein I4U23_000883 [Adineta vaga]|nr:hypothetical protein I4U23_000883 [Adineta vaga]
MSQKSDSSLTDKNSSLNDDVCEKHVILSTLSNAFINNSNDNSTINQSANEHGWANFNALEKQNSENNNETTSNNDWADFQTTTNSSTGISNDQINHEDDAFGDYGEVQDSFESHIPTVSMNLLSNEQIQSVIATCFPLEYSTSCTENDNLISTPLPTFTTCKKQIHQTAPSFHHSLSLWNVLVNVSNDPLGIQHQWRKSNVERLFHQALGVQERFRTKINPVNSVSDIEKTISNDNNENQLSSQTINPSFDWKSSGLENPLTDNHNSFLPTDLNKSENHVIDVNKTLDLDYSIPPLSISINREQQSNLSTIVHRNSNPNLSQQSITIKTLDLFPGSTTMSTDDTKSVPETVPNFTFMSPKALLFSTQINTESNTSY